jgi:hypothetical protein
VSLKALKARYVSMHIDFSGRYCNFHDAPDAFLGRYDRAESLFKSNSFLLTLHSMIFTLLRVDYDIKKNKLK